MLNQTRSVVALVLGIGGRQHTVARHIEDRSHLTHPLVFGRDSFERYRLDVIHRIESAGIVELDGDEECGLGISGEPGARGAASDGRAVG